MGKFLIGAVAAVGTSVTGVSTVALASSSSQEPNKPLDIPQLPPTQEERLEPTVPKKEERRLILGNLVSSKDIETSYTRIDCLKNHFKLIVWKNNDKSSDVKGEFKSYGKTDNNISDLSTGSLKGCLLVEYDKIFYKNGKWNGNFQAIWSLSNETKGFILVTTAKTIGGTSSLEIDGSIYVLNKENKDKPTWKVESHGRRTETQVNADNLSKFLSQPGTAISDLKSTNYWGFNPQLNELCPSTGCGREELKKSYLSAVWEFKGGNEGKPMDWSGNFNEWTKSLFPKFLKEGSPTITQKGKWEKKTLFEE